MLSAEQQRQREEFMRLWHERLPSRYRLIERFNHGAIAAWPVARGSRTLEIGAGLGAHSHFEDLAAQEYHCLEYRPDWCRELAKLFPEDRVHRGDIHERQPWPEHFFDRIIAIHVLEHLVNLPVALAEIARLLKPDGVFDVVLPCEGGLAYTAARKLSAERMFRKRFGGDYTPIVQNEHVSTLREVVGELGRRFKTVRSRYFPWRLPSASLNLCVALRLTRLPPAGPSAEVRGGKSAWLGG